MRNGVDNMFYIGVIKLPEVLNNDAYILAIFAILGILFLIMIIYYQLRMSKLENHIRYLDSQTKAPVEVEQIAKKIGEDIISTEVKVSNFEDEQEQKAIISYEELLKKQKPIEFYQKPEDTVLRTKPVDVLSAVPSDVREQAIKEKPVIRRNQEFLSTLINFRSRLK